MDLLNRPWQPDQPLTEHQLELVENAQQCQPRALLLSWANDPDYVRRAMCRRAHELQGD